MMRSPMPSPHNVGRSPLVSPSSTASRAGDTLGLDDFSLRGALGTGGTSQVLLVQRKGAAGFFAMKVIPKAALEKSQIPYIISENRLLRTLSHPYLVRLHAAFQDPAHFYLVLQHYGGGDLAQHLLEHGELDEPSARIVLGGLVLALRYLHDEHNVIYRDLKPENVLLDHRDGLPVLADFGAAKDLAAHRPVGPDSRAFPQTHTHIGTPLYMAPELWQVSKSGYGFGVDWWAAGVLLHEMLLGDVPWAEGGFCRQSTIPRDGNATEDWGSGDGAGPENGGGGGRPLLAAIDSLEADIAERARALTDGPFRLSELPSDINPAACALITGLLQTEPSTRLGCGPIGGAEVEAHAFFAPLDWDALLRRQIQANLCHGDQTPLGGGKEQQAKGRELAGAAFHSFDASHQRRDSGEQMGMDFYGAPTSTSYEGGGGTTNTPRRRRKISPPNTHAGGIRALEVSADGKLWSISPRLASMLGLTNDATATDNGQGRLQMVLGRHARALVLAPYEERFHEAVSAALEQCPGADEKNKGVAALKHYADGPVETSIGVAGRSGASLLLHCTVSAVAVPAGDVSNLFASSAHLRGVRMIIRFVAGSVSLLGEATATESFVQKTRDSRDSLRGGAGSDSGSKVTTPVLTAAQPERMPAPITPPSDAPPSPHRATRGSLLAPASQLAQQRMARSPTSPVSSISSSIASSISSSINLSSVSERGVDERTHKQTVGIGPPPPLPPSSIAPAQPQPVLNIIDVADLAGGRVYNGSSYAPSGHDRASDVTACRPDDQEAAATDSEELKALMTLGDDMSAPAGRETTADMVHIAQRSALLHQVQRERGVSCASVASRGSLEYFDVYNFRARTDATDPQQWYAAKLNQVRNVVDRVVGAGGGGGGPEVEVDPAVQALKFYEVFSSYCSICEELLMEQDAMVGAGHDKGVGMVTAARGDAVAHTLCIFSRLKESVGRQRAFLCGALALPERAIPAFSTRAFADMVICVHQQKAYEDALEQSAPASLLQLLRPGLAKPAALAQIQRILESKFDVMAVRASLTVQRCWELHTEHINTLRRLEILLSNEVLRSTEVLARQRTDASKALHLAVAAIANGDSSDAEVLYQNLAQLPSAVVQAELLATLDKLRRGVPRTERTVNGTPRGRGRGGHHYPGQAAKGGFGSISLEEVRLEQRIGEGASGTTYRGMYRGTQVAVKVAGVSAGGFSHWRHEVAVLAHIRHTNVVRYFGAVESPPTYCLILEYCEKGDLRSALDENRTPPNFFWHVAAGVASGMLCLHSNGLMHRDLKSPNVLLDRDGVVKLTDFGLAVQEDALATPRDAEAEAGTFRWMAPEVARRRGFRRPADVYSYGMVLFELLTHDLPFADVAALHAVAIVAVHGARPPLPQDAPVGVCQLIEQCWSEDANQRPTFEVIEPMLASLRADCTEAELEYLSLPSGHPVYVDLGMATLGLPPGMNDGDSLDVVAEFEYASA